MCVCVCVCVCGQLENKVPALQLGRTRVPLRLVSIESPGGGKNPGGNRGSASSDSPGKTIFPRPDFIVLGFIC